MTKVKTSEKILDYIKSFSMQNGYPPSVREICSALKISSTATVAYNIEKLVKSGQLKKSASKNRTLEVVDEFGAKPNFIQIPLVGTVAAGTPILAVENIEEVVSMPRSLFNQEDLFMLTVKGDSMINAGINDGDKIVVRKQATARNGEIAVALVDDSATVKRFYKEYGHFRLQPENDYLKPIIVDHVDILGIVIGLLRKF